LLDVAKVFFEPIQPFMPDLPVLFDPPDRGIEWHWLETARSVLSVATPTDQTGLLEHFEMLRDCLKGDLERFGELVDCRLSDGQTGEDRPSGRVGESSERVAELVAFRMGLRIHVSSYSTE
jgi:hypothetical protein